RLKQKLGAVNSVSQGYAAEADDLATAVRKAGSSFALAGGDLNSFLGLVTSIRATTRESAEEISTGLRTILQRSQRSDTVDALKELGIELRYTREQAESLGNLDLEGKLVKPFEVFRRLSTGFSNINSADVRFSAGVEALGGYRQVSRVTP